MRFKIFCFIVVLLLPSFEGFAKCENEAWGFFGHRLINRTAVFTLPYELIPLYKSNLEFITEHAIDPDKRRYASPLEAVRHYIDLDLWGEYPYENIPRKFEEALTTFCSVHVINQITRDTVETYTDGEIWEGFLDSTYRQQVIHEVRLKTFEVLDEGYLKLPKTWLPAQFQDDHELIFTERFSAGGIIPFHLQIYQGRLTNAFREKDWPMVLRLSTEIGHYISDAHVPLHTTENYNGQLTGQDGIHAFWESRIPELFSDDYDFFVGRASYIKDIPGFFWKTVLESNTHVAAVLGEEKALREKFAKDKQYCFEERGAVTTRLECEEYAAAYQDAMQGMVEDRMRKSISAVGSAWYTAWVDAGMPDVGGNTAGLAIDTIHITPADSLNVLEGY